MKCNELRSDNNHHKEKGAISHRELTKSKLSVTVYNKKNGASATLHLFSKLGNSSATNPLSDIQSLEMQKR
jgi:hypothetical protein